MDMLKKALIDGKIAECDRSLLSLAIDAQAAKMTSNDQMLNNATKQTGEMLKLKAAFQQILSDEMTPAATELAKQ